MRRKRLKWLVIGLALLLVVVGVPLALWAADDPLPTDSAALTELAQIAAGFPRADSASLTESAGVGFPRADPVSLTELIQSAAGFLRAESATVAELAQSTASFPRARGDIASIGESAGVGFPRADPVSLTELIQSAASFLRADPVSLTESILSTAGFPRADPVSLTESAGLGFPRAEGAAVAESALSTVGFPRADPVSLTESALSAASFPRADSATLTESASLGFPTAEGDIIGIGESALSAASFPRADPVSLTESIVTTAGSAKTDSATIAESGQFSLGVPLQQGWGTFSIPIYAQNSKFFATPATLGTSAQDGLVDESKVVIAYKFNAATQGWQQIVTGATLSPLEGVLVRSSESHSATLIISTSQTSPPTRTLSQGWNLMALAPLLQTVTMPADEALISVFGTPSGLVGYTQVVSPSMNPVSFAWTREAVNPPSLERWRAYWVFMENQDTLAGFSSTPL